jgi:alkane 1-monooxygenase
VGNYPKFNIFIRIWVIDQKNITKMKDLKYLFAYTIPISVYISFISTGIWTYSAIFYVFLLLPILDFLLGETDKNLSNKDASYLNKKWIFDIMLYFNLPIIFGLLYIIFSSFQVNNYSVFETIGLALSTGILLATNELGHRKPYFERFLSKFLYMPCLYMLLY